MGKRGRKKKQGAVRTPSGRISRAASAYNENAEPFRIRGEKLGLSPEKARDQKAASAHGLMFLRKKISEIQYQAGERMLDVRRDYLKAIRAPDSLAVTSGSGGSEDTEDGDYIDWCNRSRARYADAERAIRDAQAVHRHANLWGALDYMLWRNEYHEHMEGDLSTVLRVLSVHFGLTEIRKSGHVEDELVLRKICA